MELMESALSREVLAITNNASAEGNSYLSAELHVGGRTLKAMKVLQLDQVRDYLNKYTDESVLRLTMGAGMYSYHVYPNLANIEITLYRTPLAATNSTRVMSKKIESERYTVTLLNPEPLQFTSGSKNMPSEFALDHERIMELDFQIINKATEQFRMKTIGGIFRKTTVEAIVKLCLTAFSKGVETDGGNIPLGVQMVPSPNTKEREHVNIPQGTRMVDVPQYVHNTCGVYPTGFAYYYQNDYWYVFPPFDNKKFDQAVKTLTIIRVPAKQLPNIERTYRRDGNNLVILATGDTALANPSEQAILNEGNGVRFADASQFMEDFVGVDGNKALASRGATNNEFVSLKRANGNNNVMMSQNRITANPMVEYSKMAARDGTEIAVNWSNSDPALIFPGMQAKILYLEGEKIKHIFATVIGALHNTKLHGQGITSGRHDTTSAIRLFARREISG